MKKNFELEEYLIDYLKMVNGITEEINIDNRLAIRALMNITETNDLQDDFYKYQDEYLKSLLETEEIIDVKKIKNIKGKIAITLNEITLVKADSIVNCANYTLEGCKNTLHSCLDNKIHSFAGLQLRRDCKKIANKNKISVGNCYVTKGYNLLSKYIFHVIVNDVLDDVTDSDKEVLKNCYINALKEADNYNCRSIVFPSMEFDSNNYPVNIEAVIAYETVCEYLDSHPESDIEKVVFCLDNGYAYSIYEKVINNDGKVNNYKLNKSIKFF